MWLGLVFEVLGIGLAALEEHHGEAIVNVVGSVVWLTVSGVCFISLRAIGDQDGLRS